MNIPSQALIKVQVYNTQKDLKVSKKSVRALVKAVLQHERSTHLEASIYLVPVKKICELHQEFFNDPTQTDCMSFPLDETHLGEVFACPQTAIEYAQKNQRLPYEELSLYIIHGILHCLGYDDLEPSQRRVMRKKEKSNMDFIKSQDLFIKP